MHFMCYLAAISREIPLDEQDNMGDLSTVTFENGLFGENTRWRTVLRNAGISGVDENCESGSTPLWRLAISASSQLRKPGMGDRLSADVNKVRGYLP